MLDYWNIQRIVFGLRLINSSFDEDMFNSKIFRNEEIWLASNINNRIEASFKIIEADAKAGISNYKKNIK